MDKYSARRPSVEPSLFKITENDNESKDCESRRESLIKEEDNRLESLERFKRIENEINQEINKMTKGNEQRH